MKRMVVFCGILALITLALSACDPHNNLQGPLSVRLSDGEIEVAVCTSMESTGVLGYARNVGGDWIEVWKGTGTTTFASGDVLSADNLAERFPEIDTLIHPDLDGDSEFSFAVYGSPNAVASIRVARNTDGWTHPDGSTTTMPCE
jgi:hypothetical protein